ncbi:hypothetical protein [Dasineura jujubifolia toursvirus 2a]|nr:hypothetical protein [Dasineura jujubifolia toursvirus 2a]
MDLLSEINFCTKSKNWSIIGLEIKELLFNNIYNYPKTVNIFYFEPENCPCLKPTHKLKIVEYTDMTGTNCDHYNSTIGSNKNPKYNFINSVTSYKIIFETQNCLKYNLNVNVVFSPMKKYQNIFSVLLNSLDILQTIKMKPIVIIRDLYKNKSTIIERDFRQIFPPDYLNFESVNICCNLYGCFMTDHIHI